MQDTLLSAVPVQVFSTLYPLTGANALYSLHPSRISSNTSSGSPTKSLAPHSIGLSRSVSVDLFPSRSSYLYLSLYLAHLLDLFSGITLEMLEAVTCVLLQTIPTTMTYL